MTGMTASPNNNEAARPAGRFHPLMGWCKPGGKHPFMGCLLAWDFPSRGGESPTLGEIPRHQKDKNDASRKQKKNSNNAKRQYDKHLSCSSCQNQNIIRQHVKSTTCQ